VFWNVLGIRESELQLRLRDLLELIDMVPHIVHTLYVPNLCSTLA
jgi:hypothetical protein